MDFKVSIVFILWWRIMKRITYMDLLKAVSKSINQKLFYCEFYLIESISVV